MSTYNMEGLSLEITDPALLDDDEWREIQAVDAEAWLGIGRTPEEIAHYLNLADFDTYVATHADPNEAVKRGLLNQGQMYENASIVIVRDGEDVVGFVRGANNISGESDAVIQAKRLLLRKNYATLQEAAVHPDLQHRGIAQVASHIFLDTRQNLQPVTAYTFAELSGILKGLKNLGFTENPVGSREHDYFGNPEKPAQQYRLVASTVYGLKRAIKNNPNARRAIKEIQEHTSIRGNS